MGEKRPSYDLPIVRLLQIFRGDWNLIAIVIVYAVGIGLCSLAIPIAVKSLVNSVALAAVLQPLVMLTIIAGGVLTLSSIMNGLQFCAAEMLQRRIIVKFALTLAQRVPHVEYKLFKRKYGEAYLTRFLEAFTLQKTATSLLLDGIAVFVQTSLGLILLAFYHPFFLAVSFILGASAGFIILLGRGGFSTSISESDSKYRIASWLQDIGRIPVIFKSTDGESFALKRTDELVSRYLNDRAAHFRILLRQHISSLVLQVVASCIVLGLGGFLVLEGQLTLGQLVAAELIITVVLGKITKFGKQLEIVFDMAAAVAKLDSLLLLPQENLTGGFFQGEELPVSLSIKKLSIKHENSLSETLEDVSLNASAGDKVLLFGGGGSGKTTLIDAIYRLIPIHAGQVEIDGHNVIDIHPQELRSEVGLVRDVEIFDASIEENLSLGRPEITLDHIREALDFVEMSDEVNSLPNGLKSRMAGAWGPFSFGQASRLMIARAILHRPRLLIIDGTMDRIDAELSAPILSRLTAKNAPWTLLLTTLNKEVAALGNFNVICKLENGKLQRQ